MNWKGSGRTSRVLIEALSRYLHGGTEENYEKIQHDGSNSDPSDLHSRDERIESRTHVVSGIIYGVI
jgi:hypothetical protein